MSDPIGGLWESETNSILASLQSTYDYLISINLNESTLYWDVVASDGVFEQNSSNGPFMFYAYIGENPVNNEDTYLDLLLAIGILDTGVVQPITPHLNYITQKMSLLIYLITF